MEGEIAAFFDDFNEAFATFDGHRVATKFSLPFLARSSDGSSKVFSHQEELTSYFHQFLDDYRARGCVSCRYQELQVTALGEAVALASVRWLLFNSAMTEVMGWRESYLLSIGSGAATAFATIDHATEELFV